MKSGTQYSYQTRWLVFILVIIGSLLPACGTSGILSEAKDAESETAEENAGEEQGFSLFGGDVSKPTPIPIGVSRANPVGVGETAVFGQFEVEILETLRGDPAWQEIHLANHNNKLPPEGWEYLLLKMRLHNKSREPERGHPSIHVTGDSRVLHFSFDNNVVAPKPWVETDIVGGAESEGWEAYLIRQGEGNLMLVAEDFDSDDPPVYIAIDEGASISFDRETMLNIPPTELGTDPAQPVPFGQTATAEDWQIIVLDVVSGEEAWEIIFDTNQFNDPPPENMVYMLVHLRVRYIGLEDGEHNINESAFTLLTNSGAELELPSLVDPEPELYYDLYAGGEADGWIVLQAPEEAKNLTLRFNPSYDRSGANERYLSLGQGR